MQMKLTLFFFFLSLSCYAQTTTWNTYAGTVSNPVVTFTQFGTGWNVAMLNTKATFYLPNFKCPACPVCPPVIDPKTTAEYLTLQNQLTAMTAERDKQAKDATDLRKMLAQEINLVNLYQEKFDSVASVNAQLFADIRRRKAEEAKYRKATILIRKDSL